MRTSIARHKLIKGESALKGNVNKVNSKMYKRLLICGTISSLLYAGMNIFIPMLLKGYDPFSQTLSELSAIGTSTRPLWVVLGIMYTMLIIAFGLGIWAGQNRLLRIAGGTIVIYGIIGLFWPPMHQREALAAGAKRLQIQCTLFSQW